jgi:hypothetical protein
MKFVTAMIQFCLYVKNWEPHLFNIESFSFSEQLCLYMKTWEVRGHADQGGGVCRNDDLLHSDDARYKNDYGLMAIG